MKIKILLLLLIIAAGYPVYKMRFDNHVDYDRTLEQLQELQILDAETNSLMMRSRLDIDKNYDHLSVLPEKIRTIQAGISAGRAHFIETNNTSFVSNFEQYMEAE